MAENDVKARLFIYKLLWRRNQVRAFFFEYIGHGSTSGLSFDICMTLFINDYLYLSSCFQPPWTFDEWLVSHPHPTDAESLPSGLVRGRGPPVDILAVSFSLDYTPTLSPVLIFNSGIKTLSNKLVLRSSRRTKNWKIN